MTDEQYPPSIMPFGFGQGTDPGMNNTQIIKSYLIKHGKITKTKALEISKVVNVSDVIRHLRKKGMDIKMKLVCTGRMPKRFETVYILQQ